MGLERRANWQLHGAQIVIFAPSTRGGIRRVRPHITGVSKPRVRTRVQPITQVVSEESRDTQLFWALRLAPQSRSPERT